MDSAAIQNRIDRLNSLDEAGLAEYGLTSEARDEMVAKLEKVRRMTLKLQAEELGNMSRRYS